MLEVKRAMQEAQEYYKELERKVDKFGGRLGLVDSATEQPQSNSKSRLTRRSFLQLSGAAGLAAIIAACGTGEAQAPGQVSEEPQPTPVPTERPTLQPTEVLAPKLTIDQAGQAVLKWQDVKIPGPNGVEGELVLPALFITEADERTLFTVSSVSGGETRPYLWSAAQVGVKYENQEKVSNLPMLIEYDIQSGATYAWGLFLAEDQITDTRLVADIKGPFGSSVLSTSRQLVAEFTSESEGQEEGWDLFVTDTRTGDRVSLVATPQPGASPTAVPERLPDRFIDQFIGFITGARPVSAAEPEPTAEPTRNPEQAIRESLDQAGILVAEGGVYDYEVLEKLIGGRDIDVSSLSDRFSDSSSGVKHSMGVEGLLLGSFAVIDEESDIGRVGGWIAVREPGTNSQVGSEIYSDTRFVPFLVGMVRPGISGRAEFVSLAGYWSGEGSIRKFEGLEDISTLFGKIRSVKMPVVDRYHNDNGWEKSDSGIDFDVPTRREAAKVLLSGTYVDELSGEPGTLSPRGVFELAASRGEMVVTLSVNENKGV